MFTPTWITEKELERVIENEGDKFLRKKNMEIQSGGEKMRNASGQQGEHQRPWKIKANLNTTQETKYWVSTFDNSSIKIMCSWEVWRFSLSKQRCSRAKQRQGKEKKRAPCAGCSCTTENNRHSNQDKQKYNSVKHLRETTLNFYSRR